MTPSEILAEFSTGSPIQKSVLESIGVLVDDSAVDPTRFLDSMIRLASVDDTAFCRKDCRIAVIVDPAMRLQGIARNGQPGDLSCDLSCSPICGKTAIHAEERAIRQALGLGHDITGSDVVHLAFDTGPMQVFGEVPPRIRVSGRPRCIACSKVMLDAGVHHLWLFHGTDQGGVWARWPVELAHAVGLAGI